MTASYDASLTFWDLIRLKPYTIAICHGRIIVDVAVSTSLGKLITMGEGLIQIWSYKTFRPTDGALGKDLWRMTVLS